MQYSIERALVQMMALVVEQQGCEVKLVMRYAEDVSAIAISSLPWSAIVDSLPMGVDDSRCKTKFLLIVKCESGNKGGQGQLPPPTVSTSTAGL